MSLRHAILTALLEGPSSGRELTQRFDKSIRFFWSATHQQIYRELGKLEAEELVKAVPQPPSRGNPKPYEVLPRGREDLVDWVAKYEGPRANRDPLLVRLRAATVVGHGALLEQLRAHCTAHEHQLAEYLAIAERDFADPEKDDVTRMQYLILRAGIGLEEHWISWLREAIAEFSAFEPGHPGHNRGKANTKAT